MSFGTQYHIRDVYTTGAPVYGLYGSFNEMTLLNSINIMAIQSHTGLLLISMFRVRNK